MSFRVQQFLLVFLTHAFSGVFYTDYDFITLYFGINQNFGIIITELNCIAEKITQDGEGGNLAASKIRNLECPSYEICLIDYGCGKFNRKIHIMEQYP